MDLMEMIQSKQTECKENLETREESVKQYPKGDVHFYKSRDGYMAKYCDETGKYSYIPKGHEDYLKTMAQKALCLAEIADCKAELHACEMYLKAIKKHPHAVEKLMKRPGMRELIENSIRFEDPDEDEWMHQPYEKLTRYEDRKTVVSVTGEMVRSKSESICLQLFYDLHIPFHYEQKWIIGGHELYPDFTVMRPLDHSICIVELFGMMGNPRYTERAFDKLGIYMRNGWIPDQNLYCFYESDTEPLDVWFLKMKLEHFLVGKS